MKIIRLVALSIPNQTLNILNSQTPKMNRFWSLQSDKKMFKRGGGRGLVVCSVGFEIGL